MGVVRQREGQWDRIRTTSMTMPPLAAGAADIPLWEVLPVQAGEKGLTSLVKEGRRLRPPRNGGWMEPDPREKRPSFCVYGNGTPPPSIQSNRTTRRPNGRQPGIPGGANLQLHLALVAGWPSTATHWLTAWHAS